MLQGCLQPCGWAARLSQGCCFSVWVITVTLPNVTPIMATPTPEGQFGEDLAMLTSLARERGFTLKDVPRDGNCLFSAVQLQLSNVQSLRQQLVSYFEDHPYAHDGTTHLRDFVAVPFVGSDPHNADTEMPNEEDQRLNSIEDTATRLQLRWWNYLERLASGAWGDHIAVQGLADMLHVDVHIVSTINPNMEQSRPATLPLVLSILV